MNQPKSIIFAAVLSSLGIVGCGGSEQLKVAATGNAAPGGNAAIGDIAETPSGAVPKEVSTDEELTVLPPSAAPQSATAPTTTDDVVEPVASGEAVPAAATPTALPADSGTDASGETMVPPSDPFATAETEPVEPAMAVPADQWWKPKASENLKWQWQLQGEIDTTFPVQVYNIDINVPQDKIDELKARGIKLICYFSAGTVESFRSDSRLFPQEIIGEQYEDLIDEQWVDYADIDALAPIMRARIERCKSKGFDAIEIDNVDAHNYESRDEQGNVVNIGTNFNMTLDESIAYVRWLTNEAHSRGLGIGLKNAEEMVADVVDEVDWMLVEDCFFDSWCLAATAFIDADKPVFMAEYDELVPDFAPACELAKSLGYSAIWRDTSLSNRLYLACE